jgi:alpha-glucosidase
MKKTDITEWVFQLFNKSMKNNKIILLLLLISITSCKSEVEDQSIEVFSPNKKICVTFDNLDSKLFYSVKYEGEPLIAKSAMGFEFKNMEAINENLIVTNYEYSNEDQTWEQPWGESKMIRDNHNKLFLELKETNESGRKINIEFKVFNEGIGFRYILPKQKGIDTINITNELTEFSFTGNHKSWSIPAYDKKKYELLYKERPLNELDTIHTPVVLKTKEGVYISIQEAALVNYSSMTLYGDKNNKLSCDLVPWKDGIKVKLETTFKTPWRTIQIAEKSSDLIESNIILNLNEPNKLGDVSWVKPMKYIGIWWGMHIGKWTFHQGPKLGATTENTIKYIDFAAKHGFDEVLVEGWNEGFDADWAEDFGPNQNFTQPNPNFDLFRLQDYAKEKGVTLQAYNETCANTSNYLAQIDSAFTLYESLGYKSVKVGQVNFKLDNGEWHNGQYGVNYYQTVVEKGAAHHLSINFHEPIKATGLRRTYPNLVSREGARGQEYNGWGEYYEDGNNPPEHLTILPFTRLLGGPMDFTPGIFRVDIPQDSINRVNTTLSKQLALYVVIYSPIQMAADLIENYENHPAFQFIKDVPTDWDTTKVIDSEIGDFVIIARKDIASEDWYLGGITDEEKRSFTIKLDFLDDGAYEAQIYQDSKNTDLKLAPMEYEILKQEVNSKSTIDINMANSGGIAIRFKKLN